MTDIVVTWPWKRPLDSYLGELKRAEQEGLVINFRVSRPPKGAIDRCYIVHAGHVRGFNEVIEVMRRGEHEVARVPGDPQGGFWPAGWYIVRRPRFYPITGEVKMIGFQGWRYFDRSLAA